MLQFEIKSYGEDGGGKEVIEYQRFNSDSAARSYVGRLSKKIGGPVDLARAGGAEWNERYMTTASPSEYHATGYQFLRLTD